MSQQAQSSLFKNASDIAARKASSKNLRLQDFVDGDCDDPDTIIIAQHAMVMHQTLDEMFGAWVLKMEMDGNCLFSSISDQLDGDLKQAG